MAWLQPRAACILTLAVAASQRHQPGDAFCENTLECSSTSPPDAASSSLIQIQRQSARTEAGLQSKTKTNSSFPGNAPCTCEADDADWAVPETRDPKCIFIDLGAADGNTFKRFLDNGYGNVSNCPSGGAFEAILVEANPMFGKSLMQLQSDYNGAVRSLVSAAYMCEGTTSFYLDTIDVAQNFWGSSMSPNTRDVMRSGNKRITVPLTNIARLIVESTIPEDYVLVKMDIEGSEHDIVPCLVQSRAAKLIDALYVEKHPEEWSLATVVPGSLQRALSTLQQGGMTIPDYDTPSF